MNILLLPGMDGTGIMFEPFVDALPNSADVQIAKLAPDSITHIVFAASFLEQPSVLAKFGNLIPKAMLNYSLYPESIVKQILFGKYSSQYLMGLFQRAMSGVSLDLLEFRIKQICNLNQPEVNSDIPATYLQATHDMLVSDNAIEVFKMAYANLSHKTVDGSHFVLQTNPKDSLREVSAIAA